ncbi:surface-adhesin E family protein [Geobacter benzoatilyticus]|uniref:Surface-adhesin protein E-like domain-containing protein n=1 Tax=Geobacter benzoatilyticus TaxID=2815309 RepID=A0ABX7Q2Z3_9BACT|nr:hypothetical protein [Geobacter benzoatilyticus]QSV45792.1 hypothetical protein JZM60_00395 [Geobacter benzoatilyticus]
MTIKRHIRTLAISTVMMAVSIPSLAADNSWEIIDDNPAASTYSYDSTSVAEAEEGLVTVWTRVVYTDEGKADALDTIGNPPEFKDLTSTDFLYTINCSEGMSRLEKVIHRKGNGEIIKEYSLAGKTPWTELEGETRMSLLREAVCDQP